MYSYEVEKKALTTPEGQRILKTVKRSAELLILISGAMRYRELEHNVGSGLSWTILAAVEWLVEQGELRELTDPAVFCHYRVFVAAKDNI